MSDSTASATSTAPFREWRLRTTLVALLLLASTLVFGIIAASVLIYRVPAVLAEDREQLLADADGLARYFEQLLGALEARLGALRSLPDHNISGALTDALLDTLGEGGFQAIYLLDRDGRVVDAAVPELLAGAGANLRGADLSRNPLVTEARRLGRRIWSDRYLSPLSGGGTAGVAVPAGQHLLIAELAPDFAREAITRLTARIEYPVLVVDRAGETVGGRNLAESDRLRNWGSELAGVGIGEGAGEGGELRELRFAGNPHDAAIARSGRLGWLFVVTRPAGFDNPRVRVAIIIVGAGMLAAIILSLIFAPLWARRLNASLQALTDRTRAMAAGDYSASVPRGRLAEFNQLAADMEKMARAVRQRQAELERSEQRLRRSLQRVRELNIDLESRVERRTAALELANEELSQALSTLQVAKTELARTETLAALGNLVGGVAHELNTPIGNAVMAASTLNDEVAEFARMLGEGVRRSRVEAFTARVEQGTAIALRNLQRASELISSFKQVAVDQTSMQRRDFDLGELVDEILLTLQPMLRRTPFKIEREIPRDITLDSYPGSLGQVLTNLLGNAIVHGLEGRVSGTIRISARALEGKSIELEVADDGAGIDPELFDRIFEPFVTSKAGQGGTGLGLHIVWNAVTAVLGGSVSVDSKPGQGTCFRIRLPRVAPQQDAAG